MAKKGLTLKRKHPLLFSEKVRSSNFNPWVEDFSPASIEELAIHKKKISEIQAWLQKIFCFKGEKIEHPILLLTGPPGAGKTACVKTICDNLKAEIFIWTNTSQERIWKPNDGAVFTTDTFNENENQTSAFSRFLLHSAKYSLYSASKKVILIEEFPNALLRNPEDFHSIMRKFNLNARYPAIFIISDNTKGESSENRLFPKDLQLSLNITNISFNPVAPTMLMKVLLRINYSSKVQSSYEKLSKSQLEDIAANSKGDIRNAINTMQFMCITESSQSESSSSSNKKKTNSKDCALKRDASLFLFHALGKVLYCKRDASLKSEKDRLPDNMKHLERDPLIETAEDVYEKTSISADGFNLFLQENHIPFLENIQVATECSKWLSEADAISADWSMREIMSQYGVSLATRGLMFNLVPSGSGRKWRSLHKPQYYENNSKKNRTWSSLKYAYKGASLSMRELQIDFIPFIAKIKPKDFKPAQIAIAKEIGEMNVKRISRPSFRSLDEKDCFEMKADFTEDVETLVDSENCFLNDSIEEDLDEDIIIEEYDF